MLNLYECIDWLTGDSGSHFSIKEAWLLAAFPPQPSGRGSAGSALCSSSSLSDTNLTKGAQDKLYKGTQLKKISIQGNSLLSTVTSSGQNYKQYIVLWLRNFSNVSFLGFPKKQAKNKTKTLKTARHMGHTSVTLRPELVSVQLGLLYRKPCLKTWINQYKTKIAPNI